MTAAARTGCCAGALSARLRTTQNYVTRRECQGQVWEAAMLAAHKKLDNLVVLVDNNKMQIDGLTENVCGIEDVASKFDAFGFNTVRVNGNDEEEIDRALCEADNVKGRPTCIVMDTVKGEGVSIFKNMGFANHSCNVSAEQLETALAFVRAKRPVVVFAAAVDAG
ncbi:MAG: thiamine pyrophosphate-dependent enzyme, partial [Christensenellales bacterium]